MRLKTQTHTAEVVDGVLTVNQLSERHLTVVNAGPQGTTVEAVPYSSFGPAMAADPLFRATWAGDGYANVDLDCGAMRWNGTKPMRFIRTSLRRAGFDGKQVDALFRQMRKVGPQSSVHRSY